MFIHYCSVKCVFKKWILIGVLTAVLLLWWYMRLFCKIRFRKVFRILANKDDRNYRIKNHDLRRLIDLHALKGFKKKRGSFFKELKKLKLVLVLAACLWPQTIFGCVVGLTLLYLVLTALWNLLNTWFCGVAFRRLVQSVLLVWARCLPISKSLQIHDKMFRLCC